MNTYERFRLLGESIPGAHKSNMFGWDCYAVGRKPFMFFDQNTQNGIAFKLEGDIHDEAFALDGSSLLNPGERAGPMKNWVVVPVDYESEWPRFAQAAFERVSRELAGQKGRPDKT